MMRPSNAHLAYYRQPPGCCCYGDAILPPCVRLRPSSSMASVVGSLVPRLRLCGGLASPWSTRCEEEEERQWPSEEAHSASLAAASPSAGSNASTISSSPRLESTRPSSGSVTSVSAASPIIARCAPLSNAAPALVRRPLQYFGAPSSNGAWEDDDAAAVLAVCHRRQRQKSAAASIPPIATSSWKASAADIELLLLPLARAVV